MKQLSKVTTVEFKYDSEEERSRHVKFMESKGFICDGKVRRSDDPLYKEIRQYYWYGKFIKYE